jgi:hypothetical protein
MFYDAIALFQSRLADVSQNENVIGTDKLISPKIVMVVGPWYLDEYGNPTREIKAHD